MQIDELSPIIAQEGENIAAHVAPIIQVYIAHPGPNELAHVAPIAHLGQICADELSPTAQALKTCMYVQMGNRL